MARTFIIGDVHGCLDELDELLDKAAITSSDRTYFVGDVIGRGPHSASVLDRINWLNAVTVQGNHERKLLQRFGSGENPQAAESIVGSHYGFVRFLQPHHWAMIRSMPLFVELPDHGACVVHAGIVGGLQWALQDPWVLTHMRSIDASGRPSSELGDESWAATYPGPMHVLFGHSAQRGLQLHPWATGLDSACVYGGHLTGLILEAGQHVPAPAARKRSLVSVAARNKYCVVKS